MQLLMILILTTDDDVLLKLNAPTYDTDYV